MTSPPCRPWRLHSHCAFVLKKSHLCRVPEVRELGELQPPGHLNAALAVPQDTTPTRRPGNASAARARLRSSAAGRLLSFRFSWHVLARCKPSCFLNIALCSGAIPANCLQCLLAPISSRVLLHMLSCTRSRSSDRPLFFRCTCSCALSPPTSCPRLLRPSLAVPRSDLLNMYSLVWVPFGRMNKRF